MLKVLKTPLTELSTDISKSEAVDQKSQHDLANSAKQSFCTSTPHADIQAGP